MPAPDIPSDQEQPEVTASQAEPAATSGHLSWRNHRFNIYWAGQAVCVMGDAFALIAMPLLVLQATGSVRQMGLVTGVIGLARILVNLFGGMLIDRLDRRMLMISCDALSTILYATIPLAWWLWGPQLWLIYVVGAAGSVLSNLSVIGYMTAMTSLVEKEHLSAANGRMQASFQSAYLVGPMLAGVICSRFGPTTAIAFDAASFAISAVSIAAIRLRPVTPEPTGDETKAGLWNDLLAGLRFVWRQPVLRSVALLFGAFNLFGIALIDLLIYHMHHEMHQPDTVVGLVMGAMGVGGIFGAMAGPAIRRRWGFGVCLIGALAGCSLFVGVMGLAPSVALLGAAAIAYSFADIITGLCSVTLRQEITPDRLLGRVTAAFWLLCSSCNPLGAAITTAIAGYTGAAAVLVGISLLWTGLTVLALFTPARMRHPERMAAVGS